MFLQITISQWKNYRMSGTKKVTNLNLVKDKGQNEQSKVSALSPREIVSELDRYVIGQKLSQLLFEIDGEDKHCQMK